MAPRKLHQDSTGPFAPQPRYVLVLSIQVQGGAKSLMQSKASSAQLQAHAARPIEQGTLPPEAPLTAVAYPDFLLGSPRMVLRMTIQPAETSATKGTRICIGLFGGMTKNDCAGYAHTRDRGARKLLTKGA